MSNEPKIETKAPSAAQRFASDDGEVSTALETALEMGSWTGAPLATERDDLVGCVLGGTYRLLRMLGEGAMGRVYEAQHTRIEGKRFAVKVLHPELVGHQELRVRFHREAEAAALIDHPNAVGVYDVGETEDRRPYIVSELLAGEDLIELLQRERVLSVPSAIRIVRQVAKALSAAHARGVIHRDVKPDNVFLTGDQAQPVAKVLDFGISRLDKSGKQLTKLGTVMGTPWYMPPEQGRGQRVDHRADVYGLGAILYRALTGVAPHDKGNPGDTLVDVLTQDLIPPRAIAPTIPEPLEAIILKAMAREAGDRFATMRELDQALAPFEPDLPPSGSNGASVGLPLAAERRAASGAGGGGAPGATRRASSAAALTILSGRAPGVGSGDGALPELEPATPESHRWTLLFLAALGAAVGFFALHGAVVAIVLLARGGMRGAIAPATAAVVAIGVGSAVTAALAAGAYRWRGFWHDPGLAERAVSGVRAPVLAAVGCYGILAALLRAIEPSLQGRSIGIAWPVWDLLLLLLPLSLGSAAAVVGPLQSTRRPWDRLVMLAIGLGVGLLMVVVIVLLRGELGR